MDPIFPKFDPFSHIFEHLLSKLDGKIVILTLGAIDSASFNSNFGTSIEIDPILTQFDQL